MQQPEVSPEVAIGDMWTQVSFLVGIENFYKGFLDSYDSFTYFATITQVHTTISFVKLSRLTSHPLLLTMLHDPRSNIQAIAHSTTNPR